MAIQNPTEPGVYVCIWETTYKDARKLCEDDVYQDREFNYFTGVEWLCGTDDFSDEDVLKMQPPITVLRAAEVKLLNWTTLE